MTMGEDPKLLCVSISSSISRIDMKSTYLMGLMLTMTKLLTSGYCKKKRINCVDTKRLAVGMHQDREVLWGLVTLSILIS